MVVSNLMVKLQNPILWNKYYTTWTDARFEFEHEEVLCQINLFCPQMSLRDCLQAMCSLTSSHASHKDIQVLINLCSRETKLFRYVVDDS